MISLSKLTVLLFLFTGLQLAQADPAFLFEVENADGSVAHYPLLPVQVDPEQLEVVTTRLTAIDPTPLALPSRHHIPSRWLPAVRDQGVRSTCAYFTILGLMEAKVIRQTSARSLRLSEECLVNLRNWMFDQGNEYSGPDRPKYRPDPNGDFPDSIIQTIQLHGVPVAGRYGSTSCQYQGQRANGGSLNMSRYLKVVSTSPNPTVPYGKGLNFVHNTAPTIGAIKNLLAQNIPVGVGVLVYQRYARSTDWFFNPTYDNSSTMSGAHAVILTGYETLDGKAIFTFKNSWSSRWGESGYGQMDEALLIKSWSTARSIDFITSLR